MATIYDVPQDELVEAVASDLEKNKTVTPPVWAAYVKTGMHKERVPSQENWWYLRSAALLRKLAIMGTVGVSKLRVKYGGNKNRGVRPGKFFKGSGNIIRTAFQQLEEAGLAKKVEKGARKGRTLTPKGQSLLDKCATAIRKPKEKKPAAPKKEAAPAPKEVKEAPKEAAKPAAPSA